MERVTHDICNIEDFLKLINENGDLKPLVGKAGPEGLDFISAIKDAKTLELCRLIREVFEFLFQLSSWVNGCECHPYDGTNNGKNCMMKG